MGFYGAGALLVASSSSAQLPQIPTQPRMPGQTLIDWVSPAILEHDIPVDQRGDESSCGATDVGDIETVALTCWPILVAYKPYLRLDYAMAERGSDATADRDQSFKYAKEVLKAIGTPRFPLQFLILANTHRIRSELFEQSGDLDQALLANESELATRQHESPPWNVPVKARAQARRIQLLLASGQRREARKLLNDVWPTLDEADNTLLRSLYLSSLIPTKDAVNELAIDALRIGDDDYANWIVSDYLARVGKLPKSYRIGQHKMMALQLFMVVRTGDAAKAAGLVDKLTIRETRPLDRTACTARTGIFPYALAPLRKHPEIASRLARLNCGPEFENRLAKAEITGVPLGMGLGFLPLVVEKRGP